jgi:hypothetical protein
MAGQWDFYQCRLNGKPASVYLDMGLKKQAPDAKRHALLVVRVFLREPNPGNGMSTDAEYDVLVAMEDQLVQSFKEDFGAVYAGRITTDGRREFFFYSAGAGDVASSARAALSRYAHYRIEAWGQADPLWKHYLEVLYPAGQSLRWIKDKAVIEALEARGDQGAVVRPIIHFSYFPSAGERAVFTGSVENAGFVVNRLSDTGRAADERPYGVVYSLSQAATLAVVSETTGLLTQLSEKNGGTYDGWECEVVGGKVKPWWRFWG